MHDPEEGKNEQDAKLRFDIETEALKRLVDYASFFHGSVEGPRILTYLKESLDGPSFRPGMSALDAAYRAGRRSVYLDILAAIGEGEAAQIQSRKTDRPQQEYALGPRSIEDL